MTRAVLLSASATLIGLGIVLAVNPAQFGRVASVGGGLLAAVALVLTANSFKTLD